MENNDLFLIKNYKITNNKNNKKDNMKITYNEKNLRISKAEIKNIFMKHQDSHLLQGRDGTYYSIINDNYYWIGIKNIEKTKREKSKTILSHGPKDHYLADLWYLFDYLKGHSNYSYVLDIIDHFSKFCNSYLLNTKEKFEIFTHIRNFIELYGKPKYLVTDNGSEFKNHLLKDYCDKNGIKFIHGLPYRPHSQGVVERLQRIIKKV